MLFNIKPAFVFDSPGLHPRSAGKPRILYVAQIGWCMSHETAWNSTRRRKESRVQRLNVRKEKNKTNKYYMHTVVACLRLDTPTWRNRSALHFFSERDIIPLVVLTMGTPDEIP